MFNCALDYLKFCNGANIEGDEVKQCFKANGKDLSQSCINALKNDGLIRSTTVIQDVTKKTREVVSGVKTKVKKIVESTKQKVESVYDSTEIFSDDGSTIYPKYLEWKDDKQYLGSELTPYGLEDRK